MKYILTVVIILILITLYFVIGPDTRFIAGQPDEVNTDPTQEETVPGENQADPVTDDDKRRALMQAEFEKLEKSRRNLERKLSRLKALLWDLEFPAEKSNEIKEQMQTGYALLKNKKLLGAYRDPENITEDLSQIDFIYENLTAIEKEIRIIKESKR